MADKFVASEWIYTVADEDNSLVVKSAGSEGNLTYDISHISVSLAHNAIPSLTATVTKRKDTPTDRISVVSVDSLSEQLNELQAIIRSNPEVILRASLQTAMLGEDAESNDVQALYLAEWELVNAGISHMSASGSLALTVELRHPAWRLTTYPCGVINTGTVLTPPKLDDLISSSEGTTGTILTMLDKAFAHYNHITEAALQTDGYIGGKKKLKTVHDTMRSQQLLGAELLSNAVAWLDGDYLKFPSEDKTGTDVNRYRKYIALNIWYALQQPFLDQYSMLQQLVTRYELTISGKADDTKLLLYPFAPWSQPLVTVYDTDISDMVLPPLDPNPVAAVIAYNPMTPRQANKLNQFDVIGKVDSAGIKPSNSQDAVGFSAFVQPLEQDPPMDGRIVGIAPPTWLTEYRRWLAMSGVEGDNAGEGVTKLSQQTKPTNNTTATVNDTVPYKTQLDMVDDWCEQSFYRLFQSGVNAAFTSRLLIHLPTDSNPTESAQLDQLRPGICVAVKSRETGDTLFVIYVLQVNHVIDLQSSAAYTTVSGAFARPGGGMPQAGISKADVNDGIANPLYNFNGEFDDTDNHYLG